jgi:hypothetical protein
MTAGSLARAVVVVSSKAINNVYCFMWSFF